MRTLLALAAIVALGTLPLRSAQSAPATLATLADDCGPLGGTIAVADDARVTPEMARTTEADARAAALRAVPGATVVDIDLDEDDGFLVYEVDLVDGTVETDVTVDAGSGAVLCTERD